MNAQVISSPERRLRRARSRLVAWAGILAMFLQLVAPLPGAVAAHFFGDDRTAGEITAVICTSVKTATHGGDGPAPGGPGTPWRDSLPCTLCVVCQAGSLGAKLVASAPLPATAGPVSRVEPPAGAFLAAAAGNSRRPPTRAPPFFV